MNKTKIEWTDFTWNPVTGCKNKCWYCYGRALNKRFGSHYEPHFWWGRLDQPLKVKKPSKIFVCSIADLFGDWIAEDTINYILDVVKKCPQHTFQFLTKNPLRYCDFSFPDNCWIGVTHTGFTKRGYIYDGYMDSKVVIAFENKRNTLLSCEPLLGGSISIPLECKWVIIGAMTGQGSQEYQPKIKWIESILNQADNLKIPVFMKNNLKQVWEGELRQEFPK